MNSSLFLAPATDRGDARWYLDETVLSGVERGFFSESEVAPDNEPVRVWGLTSNTSSTWEGVEDGDWILFYTRGNEYRYAARVVSKEHAPEIGDEIRRKVLDASVDGDRDWDYLVYLDEPVRVSISGTRMAELLNYGNDFPVRFMRVTDERWESQDEFEDVDSFISDVRVE